MAKNKRTAEKYTSNSLKSTGAEASSGPTVQPHNKSCVRINDDDDDDLSGWKTGILPPPQKIISISVSQNLYEYTGKKSYRLVVSANEEGRLTSDTYATCQDRLASKIV